MPEMTDREEAFIAQAKIIEAINSAKSRYLAESERTISSCFSQKAIDEVTTDESFKAEIQNKKRNSEFDIEIKLCDDLIEFCRTNPVCMANVDATTFLFNKGKFRSKQEVINVADSYYDENMAENIGKGVLIAIIGIPLLLVLLLVGAMGGIAAVLIPIIFVIIACVGIASSKSQKTNLRSHSDYTDYMKRALIKELYLYE
ncbi:MAG: hypothetical protein K6G52_06940 [Treponemataceae bacterium]|nr:hypothetical protein [Treponemataceae bacterium]